VSLLPPSYNGSGEVRVEVFTSAFRKVASFDFPNTPSGVAVVLVLQDDHGVPLANGIYYVRVRTPGGHSMAKLMVLH
jgi:hypothetical protein